MPLAYLPHLRLNYRFDGPEGGPVLVLTHALGTNLTIWNHIIPHPAHPALARHHFIPERAGNDPGPLGDDVDFRHLHRRKLARVPARRAILAVSRPNGRRRAYFCRVPARKSNRLTANFGKPKGGTRQ